MDSKKRIGSSNKMEFGTKVFANIYRYLPRSIFGHMAGMENETKLFMIYIPSTQKIIVVQKITFKWWNNISTGVSV